MSATTLKTAQTMHPGNKPGAPMPCRTVDDTAESRPGNH